MGAILARVRGRQAPLAANRTTIGAAMSGDEVIVTVASIVLGPAAWAWWLVRAASFNPLRPPRPPVAAFGATVGLAGLFVFFVLRFFAADDVREAPQYLAMYFSLGLAWLRLVSLVFPLAGLNPRDDLIERRNAAAIPAWMGGLFGVTCCYAGANVGNGPGWWVVVFSAALATATLGAVWLFMAQSTGLGDAVTVDRDQAAGIRLGGLLLACGVIFGSAVTGDWVSTPDTVIDFVWRAWTAIPIVVIAMVVERTQRPSPERPQAPLGQGGLLPAVIYVSLAVLATTFPRWVP
jgi:hypothetical protein